MKQAVDPQDPLARCPCGYYVYNDQSFQVNGLLVGRVITYRCAGVVIIDGSGRTRRATACFNPMDPELAVTKASAAEVS